jgi:hypothetical protein
VIPSWEELERRAAAIGFRLSPASGQPSGWPTTEPYIELVIGADGAVHEVDSPDDETPEQHRAAVDAVVADLERMSAK